MEPDLCRGRPGRPTPSALLRNGHAIIAAYLLALGCGKAEDMPAPLPADGHALALFEETADRVLEMSSPPGWVVSRWADGRIEHTGDSLLWTGMALGVLDCARGDVVEQALLGMLEETGGTAYRHPVEKHREPSLDGHLGLYWGITHRVSRCPEARSAWTEAFSAHVPVNVPGVFDAVVDATRAALAIAPAPDADSTSTLVDILAGWAGVVNAAKAAAYRVHLGLLATETLETAGSEIPGGKRDLFCAATRGMDLPTVDHWCGRGDLAAWVSDFQFNSYEYRHQRAHWESADGKDGLATPGIDLLVALRALHTF